ncbi:MAG: hypothetical protein ABIH11_00910 [Candidatus Altiarchaeota archaeon]
MDIQIDPSYLIQAFGFFMKYVLIAFQTIITLTVGYVVGLIVSNFVEALFSLKELERQFVRYGAMTSKLWGSIRSFIKHYIRWFVVALILTTTGLSISFTIYDFMTSLFWFIVLTILGLIIGGVVEKIVKDALDVMGTEDKLKKYNVGGALGGISLASATGGLLKWYIVLLFMGEGAIKLDLNFIGSFIGSLLSYIPEAISGVILIVISLILSKYASESLRQRNVVFKEILALITEVTIVFFGIVLALPILKKDVDVSVLTDSFKILMAGFSLGLAIALGFGLRDYVHDISKHSRRNV